MPYSMLTSDQIQSFLAEYRRLIRIPGVALISLEFVHSTKTDIGVVATIYDGDYHHASRLPLTVAGLPLIVKIEDRDTGRVLAVVDPRENGGTWPLTINTLANQTY